MTKIIDTSIDFSEIESGIILDFATSIYSDRVHKFKQSTGKGCYNINSGMREVGISIEEDNGNRFILVCTLNIEIDKHEMSENLRNPAELKQYLNELKLKING